MTTLFFTLEAQIVLNTLYYMDGGGTPTTGTLSGFLSAWQTTAQAQLLACSSAELTFTNQKAQYMNLPQITPQYLQPGGGTIGTGGTGHEPTTVAAVISKYSGVKGQSGRGRYYVPGVPTAGVNAGLSTITNAYLTTLTSYGAKLVVGITVGAFTYNPGIFSRRGYNKITGSGGGFSALLTTGIIIRGTLGTVRRRRLGRGK